MAEHTWRIGETPWLTVAPPAPRARVIVDNDFSGDPDDLYQVVHHLLSPSVDIRGLIGSHLPPRDPFDPGPDTARNACRVLGELFATMGLAEERVWQGSDSALLDTRTPQESVAARGIVAEAMRDDVDIPLFAVCGGGLTDVASAWLLEPRIAERLTVVWIGGPEYPGHREPPPGIEPGPEYNLAIDVVAGQVVFNESTLPLWQVPRNLYRQCLVSDIELRRRVATKGPVGELLYAALGRAGELMVAAGRLPGETYALGDSPLVLLTALQSYFQPDTSSSDYDVVPAPTLGADGAMAQRAEGRPIRVYTRLDVRLMFEDLFHKLDAFAEWQATRGGPGAR